MLDIKTLRQDPDSVIQALEKRGVEFDLPAFSALDARRKEADVRSQGLLAERKAASKKIGELVSAGASVDEAKAQVDEVLARLASDLEAATAEADAVQAEIDTLLMETPNLPNPQVPFGATEDDNVEVLKWGEPASFAFEPKDHVDLGEALTQMDFETAGKIAGARFSMLSGDLARLHRALTQFMLDTHTQAHGYQEVYVPYIVNEASLTGTGQLPKFAKDSFRLEGEQGFYLAPTAEVPVTNIARGLIYDADQLGEEGLRYVAHTPCFRSEAGSYGRDTRGLIRQHQFERKGRAGSDRQTCAVRGCPRGADRSRRGHSTSARIAVSKVILCGGDLGFSSALTYDLRFGCLVSRPTVKSRVARTSGIFRRVACRRGGAIRKRASRSYCTR